MFFVTWQQWKSLENEVVAAASAKTVSYWTQAANQQNCIHEGSISLTHTV